MSQMARWSYTSTCLGKKLLGRDAWGVPEYGQEIEIPCAWVWGTTIQKDANGNEFVSNLAIYTESDALMVGDMVSTGVVWAEIKAIEITEMSVFGDTPDYKWLT